MNEYREYITAPGAKEYTNLIYQPYKNTMAPGTEWSEY